MFLTSLFDAFDRILTSRLLIRHTGNTLPACLALFFSFHVFQLRIALCSALNYMNASNLLIDAGSNSERRGWSAVIDLARNGCRESFDILTRASWDYLIVAARERIPQDLRVKVAPSDLVQQSLMVAYSNFSQFSGTTENDLLRWLETILHHQALSTGRFYRNTHARNINLEVPLDDLAAQCWTHSQTPSRLLMAHHQKQALLTALEKLPDHYRTILKLRGLEELSFEAIGPIMGRSADAARKLWVSALRNLQKLMASENDSPPSGIRA